MLLSMADASACVAQSTGGCSAFAWCTSSGVIIGVMCGTTVRFVLAIGLCLRGVSTDLFTAMDRYGLARSRVQILSVVSLCSKFEQ